MITFVGQVVVVTGAGRGLGEAYARLIAARAGIVAVHDGGVGPDGTGGDSGPAVAVRDDILEAGGQATAHVQDLATRAGCEDLIAEVLARHGRIDALVNNAGIVQYRRITETTEEQWRRMASVNIDAPWWLSRAVWPGMVAQGYGRIVLTTSGYGLRVVDGADVAAYSVGKAAQFGLMNALAADGPAHGILVNAVAPVAATRIFRRTTAPGELPPAAVAPGVAVLASSECPVNGTVVMAVGGRWGVQAWQPGEAAELGNDSTPERLLQWFASRQHL